MKNRAILNYIAFVVAVVVVRYGHPSWVQYLALVVCVPNIFAYVWSTK